MKLYHKLILLFTMSLIYNFLFLKNQKYIYRYLRKLFPTFLKIIEIMIDVVGLYILNRRGELIYLQENIIPSTKELDLDYLSNFFKTLQTIAKKIGEEEVKIIDLGNSKFFLTKDKLTNIEFILKCEKNIKQKKVFETHKKIINLFIEKFIGNYNASEQTKKFLMNSFMKDLTEIIGKGEKIEYNIESIKID